MSIFAVQQKNVSSSSFEARIVSPDQINRNRAKMLEKYFLSFYCYYYYYYSNGYFRGCYRRERLPGQWGRSFHVHFKIICFLFDSKEEKRI